MELRDNHDSFTNLEGVLSKYFLICVLNIMDFAKALFNLDSNTGLNKYLLLFMKYLKLNIYP